jgi:DNA (cytosine-5)-methyltransferase 1
MQLQRIRKPCSIKTLDLFHGAGGSSYGARNAGAQIVSSIDLWDLAGRAYSNNFPEAKVFTSDIKTLSPNWIHSVIGDIDLLLASPECTNHTCAKGALERSEESKNTAFQVIKFATVFRPKWIIIENVIQMKSWSRHPELLEELWGLGYYVKEEKLNAVEFGVPQSRVRLFLICSLYCEPAVPKSEAYSKRSASSIINKKNDFKFTPLFQPGRAQSTIERAERAMAKIGTKEPFLIVYYGSDGSGGWQTLDKPLRTVTTIDRFAYVKPSGRGHMMRMLQPEELKLAMGFDINYKLDIGTRREKIKLMGNAVCPPVMESIVRTLLSI